MLIGVFKSNQKIVGVLVVVISFLFWIPSFFIDETKFVLIYEIPFFISDKTLQFILSSLLIAFQAVYLSYLVNRFKLMSTSSFLPSLFYIVLNSGVSILLTFTPVLVVNGLVLLILHLFFLLDNNKEAYSLSFNVGFLVAISSLIYFPVIIILPLFWFSIMYLKSIDWRDFVISIIGFFVPIIFYVSYYFLKGSLFELLDFKYSYEIFNSSMIDKMSLFELIFFYITFVVGIFVGVSTAKNISDHLVRVRKTLLVLIIFAFFVMALRFVTHDVISSYVIMTVPVSIFFAAFFNRLKKKWLAEILLTSMLVSVVLGYFL